jgi:MscS family membrane protein
MENQTLLDLLQPVIGVVGDNRYLQALTVIIIAFAIANIASYIISKIIGSLASRTASHLDDKITRLLRLPVYWTVIQVGLLFALTLVQLKETPSFIIKSIIISMLILVWSIFTARTLRTLLKTFSDRANSNSIVRPQSLPLFNNVVSVLVLVLSTYLIFSTWQGNPHWYSKHPNSHA